jgi:CRP/FNR family transcriptional regulator, cyclic AMP receptor protein
MVKLAPKIKPLTEDMAAFAYVQSSSLCNCLAPDQLTELLRGAKVEDFPLGAVLANEGDKDDSLFLVFDGTVSVCKQRGDVLLELAVLERAHVFGEIAVLMQQPRSATIIARSETRVIRLDGVAVRKVAELEPKFGRRLAALMSARIKDTAEKLG